MRFRADLFRIVLALLVFLTVGCRPTAENGVQRVRVTGASTVYPIVMLAGEELGKKGHLIVNAQAGGSTRGFEDTVAGRNDLGAMARDLTPEEESQVQKFPIAYDGVGVVVNAANTVEGLTTEDLRRIYTRQVTHWTEFGGDDAAITVVTKAEGHATLETFLDHTGLDRAELQVDAVGGDNAQVIRLVAGTKSAIGYVSLGEIIHSIEAGMPLRLVPLDGVMPTLESVANKTYPMYRTLYLISRAEPSGSARELLNFLQTPKGRNIIGQGKYVPLEG